MRSDDNDSWGGGYLPALLLLFMLIAIAVALITGDAVRFADERMYLEISKNIAEQGFYSRDGETPTAQKPPSWTLVLAAGRILTDNLIILRLINLSFHIGTALLLWRFLRKLSFPTAPASIAAALYFFYPLTIFTATTFYPQTMCAFLVALALNISLVQNIFAAAALGVITSVSALAAPGMALVMCLFALIQPRRIRPLQMVPRLVAFGVAAAVVLLPWVARNYAAFNGAFIPMSTHSGAALLVGLQPDPSSRTVLEAHKRELRGLSPPEADRRLRAVVIEWTKEHPMEAAGLYVARFLNWFNFRNKLATSEEESIARAVVAFVSYYGMIIVALFGTVLWWRSGKPAARIWCFWLWALYITAGLTVAMVDTRVRYRIPFEIVLFAFATPTIAWLLTVVTRRRRKHGSPNTQGKPRISLHLNATFWGRAHAAVPHY